MNKRKYSDFSNRITHQEGLRRARAEFWKELLTENPETLLTNASSTVPTKDNPKKRASVVVAYQCLFCGDLCDINGYCWCCPNPDHNIDSPFEADAKAILEEWDAQETLSDSETDSETEKINS